VKHGSFSAPIWPDQAQPVTFTIKADENGVFTYAVPKAGWWGFAALNTSDEKLKYNGEEKDIEIGAVIWVEFRDWKERAR
jgi:cobalt/nickel transport protein